MSAEITSRAQALRLGRRDGYKAAHDEHVSIEVGARREHRDSDDAYNDNSSPTMRALDARLGRSRRWRDVYALAYGRTASNTAVLLFARRIARELLENPTEYAHECAASEADAYEDRTVDGGWATTASWRDTAGEWLQPICSRVRTAEIDAAAETFTRIFCAHMAAHCESVLAERVVRRDDAWGERMLEDRLSR